LENVPLVTDPSQIGGTSEYVLMCLASVYSQHPDFQDGWRVDGLNDMSDRPDLRDAARGTAAIPDRGGHSEEAAASST
jgi:hypothetical protein